jgi:hypothetical protein
VLACGCPRSPSDVIRTVIDGRYKKVNTIKSEVVKKTVNPVWTLPEVRMGTVDPAGYKAFMIKIWDDDTFSDDFIGALKLRPGMFFGGITPGVHDLWLVCTDYISHIVQVDWVRGAAAR